MQSDIALSTTIQTNFAEEVAFLQRIVRAKSANSFLPSTSSPDVPVERDVAHLTAQELQRSGLSPELIGISPHRPNIICHIPGTGAIDKTLILTTHMDTVEPGGYTGDPWGAHIENGRLYGVGAADAKAQIAAMIYAARAIQQAGIKLAGKLVLAFVVDEESGACSPYGTRYLLEQAAVQGNAAIIGEPGNSKVAIGHRGLYRFRIHIKGEAAHTGQGDKGQTKRGRNAILDMARLAQALSEYALPDTPSVAFPDRQSILTFPTLIHGGSSINSVPDSCEAYGDARLLPGLSVQSIKDIIRDQLRRLHIETYQLDDIVAVPAVEIDRESDIVRILVEAVESVTGVKPRVEGAGPACDGWMFVQKGIPTVCGYGVACGGVHGVDEWVDLESLRRVTEVYMYTILGYLQESRSDIL